MLEGLVAWVLNNYLGRYVENLNTDQLSIALLSGEVELENLPLRRDALRHLGAPIEIRAGFVGKVRLSIPLRQPRSAPWVISLERLYMVAGPVRLEHWDDSSAKLAEHERKLSTLDALEACWRQDREARASGSPGITSPTGNGPGGYYASSYASWLSYGTGLISDIVENVQLKVEHVHIRYEDGPGGAFGITIRSLSAQSCDKDWKPQFTHRTANQPYSYKTVDLIEMSVYWESSDARSPMSDMSMEELAAAMEAAEPHKTAHIVAPVSGYAHVSRNRSEQPLRSASEPRVVCELCLDSVPVFLADWQHELAARAFNTLNYVAEIQRQRRYRPSTHLSDDPIQWWAYALRSAGCNIYPRRNLRSWDEVLRLASENVRYVRMYERLLAQPTAGLSHEDKLLKEQVEWTRDVEQLRSLRQAAMRRVQTAVPVPTSPTTPNSDSARGRSVLAGWFPQWWGWYSTESPTEKSDEIITTVDKNPAEEELLEILSDAVRDNTVLKRDVVFGRFTFGLKSGALALCTGPEIKPAMELQFEGFQLTIESRPRSGSYSLELALGSLRLRDLLTEGTLFPALISERGTSLGASSSTNPQEPLFKLRFEALPRGARRLKVKSRPLEVVYQPAASKWLISFACGPHRRAATKEGIEAVKARTKEQLMRNWESIVDGKDLPDRPMHIWDLHLDISAPQIIFVESFCDPNAIIGVVDLGRLHVMNAPDIQNDSGTVEVTKKPSELTMEEEEEETFATPCSTPPGSEASASIGTETMATAATDLPLLDELAIHSRLYERYSAELTDLQVLTCRVRDGWRHAHTRGSSSMHVLERFSINACLERRLVRTQDPMYPALALSGQLPRLVLHVNEHKVTAIRTLIKVLDSPSTIETDLSHDSNSNLDDHSEGGPSISSEDSTTASDAWQSSRLLMLQFTVEHASVQLQSRGRSVAELQITGASMTLTRRPLDTSLTVTVHGLLLVDALQTYGPDFELLVASHRHVAMDSISGSLRDSEPTSPCSPGSPDPYQATITTPLAISTALSGLAASSPPPGTHEALICIEYTIVDGTEPVRIANIQFNNLDVIANQETVVELVGFTRRVFPSKSNYNRPTRTTIYSSKSIDEIEKDTSTIRVELTFDFHRLNVLLMRGVRDDNGDVVGRKVATLSACGARIQATVDGDVATVNGSLDGLQLLDLTMEGRMHRRIVSVGRDPLEDVLPHGLYRIQHDESAARAFEAAIHKIQPDRLDVDVRMASVWYTHSPRLLSELHSCAAEFKHYLSDVASRISAAAADVMVHQLYGHRGSVHGHVSASIDSISGIGTVSPDEDTDPNFKVKIDIVLDSPVVVLPRNSTSTQVFVAHLGRITIVNSHVGSSDEGEAYEIDFKDMNLYSLDTAPRRMPGPSVPRAEKLYSCETLAEPVLHDTILHVNVVMSNGRDLDHDEGVLLEDLDSPVSSERLEVTGSVVNELRVSLTRQQYEQLLDTFQSLTENGNIKNSGIEKRRRLHDISEEEVGVGTLRMDPHVRAGMFPTAVGRAASAASSFRQFHLGFELPVFTVELRRDTSAVELSFIEFAFSLEKSVPHETNIQVSLRSLRMDDLKYTKDNPVRHMVVSRNAPERQPLQTAAFASHSFPERLPIPVSERFGSLPDHLETHAVLGAPPPPRRRPAPPDHPRPLTDNLVLISCLIIDPNCAPDFQKRYNSLQRSTHVDFNALDLSIKSDSWGLVFDFFGGNNDGVDVPDSYNPKMDMSIGSEAELIQPDPNVYDSKSELTISVRSLMILFLLKDGKEIARSNISGVQVKRVSNLKDSSSEMDGRLGSMTINDLTEHGRLYRERFRTLGERALYFRYCSSPTECSLRLEMATVLYVHTRRFSTEFQSCLSGFGGRSSQSKQPDLKQQGTWTSLEIQAGAPVILLPVSSSNEHILVADLGKLVVSNQLNCRAGRLLDVMKIELLDMDLYAAKRIVGGHGFDMGNGVRVDRCGRSLLDDKCRLELVVERGLNEGAMDEPDLSICGDLSALHVGLDLQNYRLIRGLLVHNIGEVLDDQHKPEPYRSVSSSRSSVGERSTVTVIRLGLQNVTVRLNEDSGCAVGSIHFISSRLLLESFSDGTQDIDLLSQEILLVDTRPDGGNAFTDILSPGGGTESNGMQAEVHSRRQNDSSEFTVLLNNMRVMLIPDWWRAAMSYIFSPPMESPDTINESTNYSNYTPDETIPSYEFKLNVTNCEIVLVQDTANRNTNALTLKSTTVLSYRPNEDKPLTCNLNHCELFSCVPGREDDTALSIIDPVTVGVELNSKGELEIQLQHRLNVRLSYHDTRMLADMAANVPEQLWSKKNTNEQEMESIRRLLALGFAMEDCREALKTCQGQLEEAAVWLTENKIHQNNETKGLVWSTLTIQANLLVLTVIDDCGDADVPLAELCLSNMSALKPLDGGTDSWLKCQLSCDYYNRALSGWEPCVEPWNCNVNWESGTRLVVHVTSNSLLDINITSALVELYRLVSDSWGMDMQKPLARRRTRFVPFALKNDTGCVLYFNTVTSKLEDQEEDNFDFSLTLLSNCNWKRAEPGETVPFDFGDSHSGRRRHGDTHRPRLHILSVRVTGWAQTARVSVDRVGVYFREVGGRESGEPARTRLVFDVRLEGSARKLVTVRSALMLENLLPDPVDVRLGVSAELTVESGAKVPVPLEHSHQRLHVKPKIPNGPNYAFCQPEVDWKLSVQKPGERKHEARRCVSGGRQTGVYYLCVETRREYYPMDTSLPAHTVSLIPALLIVNLLPHELHFNVIQETINLSQSTNPPPEGLIKPGCELSVPTADPSYDKTELKISLDGFRCKTGIRIPSIDSSNEQQSRIRLEDASGRRLNLRANISVCSSSAGVRIAVSAPYWIVNKTGLPLVFRQEGVPADAAGQFEENEVARMVAPLLFSWADEEAGPSVVCRVGNIAMSGGQPQWCQPFHLRRGVQVRRLKISHPTTGSGTTKPDTILVLGIEVRPGKGRYRRTSIVTLSPRHQIHNRTKSILVFSQRCHANSVRDPGASSTHVVAVSGCQLPFHWPRLDRDQLLCVKIQNNSNTLWSGGLRIDQPRSLHVCLRDSQSGEIKFLRLEVLPRGSTMHAVFSDPADTLPPPMRIDNLSEVIITFAQQDVAHSCTARPGGSIPYAWDEPDRGVQSLVVTAPGGATAICDMDKLGPAAQLTYENFIYVAFTGTFLDDLEHTSQETRIDDQRLVLDVLEDGRVSLAPKQPGRRSQLWRMTTTGQLQHEGSPADRILVLDIEGPAPQPSKRDSRLALRRPDPRRRSTQTWRFTSDGRLCCAHDNMCVQSQEGFFGLHSGGAAVLGVAREPPLHRSIVNQKVPPEQAVGKQRMRPGSGFLSVEVTTDGPTRVLCVRDDIAERRKRNSQPSPPVEDSITNTGMEIRVVVRLTEGVGLSIVGGGPPQELLYVRLTGIVAEITSSPGVPGTRQLCLSIADIQCDNQLFDTDTQVIVYASPKMRSVNSVEWQGPALSISAELQPPLPRASVVIFRHLVVRINPLSLHVDETLLLRLMEFMTGNGRSENRLKDEKEGEDDDDEMRPGADTAATSTRTRYYVGVMSLSPGPVRLSMRTAGKLPQRLRALRRRLGLTLIQFEDASICVEPYVRRHLFDTARGLWRGVHAHFREELVWQAAIILGNVDFLGGPLGLVSDVTEGVSGLINERSVGALFMNVTHGLSNSAAKVTDALGDGLGRVLIMDEAHEEARQRIRRAGGGGSHLVAGIKGLGFGLLDGATGLFRHVYEGAANDGVQGAFAGVGRGLVGMVAKPVVGVLDFAGETARAVRDSSRGSARQTPIRKREPRVAALGPGGLLPRFGQGKEARGQKYLHKLNGGDLTERFVAYGSLRSSEIDDLRLVLGSEKVRVVTQPGGDMTVVTEVKLEDVLSCSPVTEENRNYVEITVRAGASDAPALRRPRIRCDTEEIALWAARQINFARRMLSERRYTLRAPDGGDAASTPQ